MLDNFHFVFYSFVLVLFLLLRTLYQQLCTRRVTLLYIREMNNQGKFIAPSRSPSDLKELTSFSFFLTCMPYALQQLVIRPRCRFEKAVNLSENNLPLPAFANRVFLNFVFNNHVLYVKWHSQLLQDVGITSLRSDFYTSS